MKLQITFQRAADHYLLQQRRGKVLPNYGAYIASKLGVEGLVKVLANELTGRTVTVNAIAPGPVASAVCKALIFPPKRKSCRARGSVLRTALIILGGMVLLGVCVSAAHLWQWRLVPTLIGFLVSWLLCVIGNMTFGVLKASYSWKEEFPIACLCFAPPACAAALVWYVHTHGTRWF